MLTRDVAAITMDLDDVEQLELSLRGGADTVLVFDVDVTDLARLNVDLEGAAGSGMPDGVADSLYVVGDSGVDTISIGVSKKNVLEIEGTPAQLNVEHGDQSLDSVAVIAVGGDNIHVLGTSKADTVQLAESPRTFLGGNGIAVATSATPIAVDVFGEGALAVFGGSGADTITVVPPLAGLGFSLELDGGPGNDSIGGSDTDDKLVGDTGNDILNGSGGNDVIDGGNGNDSISGGIGNDIAIAGNGNDVVKLGDGNDTALLGAGNDLFRWLPGDDNDVIEGQQGTDTLEFNCSNASENLDLSPNGGRAVLFRDVASVVMDLNDVERLTVPMQGGADHVVVNDLSGTDVRDVNLDLQAVFGGAGTGDSQVDTVTVAGSPATESVNVSADSKSVSVKRKAGNVRISNPEQSDSLTIDGWP